jgi:hypothetical protein
MFTANTPDGALGVSVTVAVWTVALNPPGLLAVKVRLVGVVVPPDTPSHATSPA